MSIQRSKLLKAVPLLAVVAAVLAGVWLRSSTPRSAGITSAAIAAPNPASVATGEGSSAAVLPAAQPVLLADRATGDAVPCDPADPRCIPGGRPRLVAIDQPAAATGSGDPAGGDISAELRQLSDANDAGRIAAAQALSASHDPRVVTALALALSKDAEPTVRREAALALGKVLDERTPNDAREVGLGALARAAASDLDLDVCVTAEHVLAGLPRGKPQPRAPAR